MIQETPAIKEEPVMLEREDCHPGDEAHRWPQLVDKCYGVEMYHCDFCGANWEEDEGARLRARETQ